MGGPLELAGIGKKQGVLAVRRREGGSRQDSFLVAGQRSGSFAAQIPRVGASHENTGVIGSHRTQLLDHDPRFREATQILTELDEISIRLLARRAAVNPGGEKVSRWPVLPLQPQRKRLSKQEDVILWLPASRVLQLSD
jgi:hypothetical protein